MIIVISCDLPILTLASAYQILFTLQAVLRHVASPYLISIRSIDQPGSSPRVDS